MENFHQLERNAPTKPAAACEYWKGIVETMTGNRKFSLTLKQSECLAVIKAHIEKTGQSPTYREIGKEMGGLLPGSVKVFVDALQERGWIIRPAHRQQSITLL